MKKVLVKVSKLLLTLVMVFSMFTTYSFAASLGQDESTIVRIHYDKGDISNWDIWAWADGIDGNNYQFTGSDDFGYIAQFNLDKIVDQVNFIVRKNDWSYRELSDLDDGNRVVHVVNGVAEAYIKADDPNTYLYKPEKEDKNIESYVPTKDQNLEKLATSADDKSTKDQIETNKTIIVHFDNPKNENWNLWLWPKNASGKEYEFSEKDDFGQYSDINVASKETEFGFLIKNPNWEKDYDKDRFIDLNKGDEVWIKSKDPNVYYENPDKPAFLYKKLSASVNLKTYNKDKKYKLKAWSDKDGETNAKKFDFVNEGNYLVAKVEFMSSTSKDLSKIYFKLIELDETGNEIREEKSSRIIKNFDENGYTRLYIVENDPKIYKHESKIEDNKITRISIDDYNTISIKLAKPTNVEELISNGYNFETNSNLTKDNILSIEAKVPENKDSNELKVKFNKKLDIEKDYSFTFYLDKAMKYPMKATAVIGNVIATKDFDDKYYYDGKLGAIYGLDQTIFRIWAPSASAVDLIAYVNGKEVKLPMDRLKKGVYQLKLAGDNELLNYQYDVRFKDGTVNRVVDPYSRSTTKNGERSVVVNPKKSIVERPERQLVKNPIIYELHVRDLSNQDQSGIKNKGRFLGLTEKGTRTPSGQKTGIDYIKDLGVSHIQLLPIYDFSKNSVDENEPLAKFNWGYDPVNYNVPEGAYSTNPDDPYSRINEMQEMIDAVHKEGMGVIMDVVYNHVSSLDEHPFNKIVPGYYFRFDENGNPYDGTGVGNEIASERKMVRKYIVDSVMYLAETYKIDGFRFDLMGILDLDTMNELCERLHEINPDIVLLGEGWDMGNHPKEIRANQKNAYKMPNIATFNDDLRDGVKGSAFDGDALGFVNGENNEEKLFEQIKTKSNVNDYKFYDNPRQLIQYTEAHDNKTSWDKIKEIYPDEDDEVTLKRQRLATTIPLLSQGLPFLHAGQEFARSKGGNENSYNASAKVNELDWSRAYEYKDNVNYIREIIAIRKNEPLFWSKTFDEVNNRVNKIVAKDGLIAYSLTDGNKTIYIAFNRDKLEKAFELADGTYYIYAREDKANRNGLGKLELEDGLVKVPPMSTLMFTTESLENKSNDYIDTNKENGNNKVSDKKGSHKADINEAKSKDKIKSSEADKNNKKNIRKGSKVIRNPKTGIGGISSVIEILAISTIALYKSKKKD